MAYNASNIKILKGLEAVRVRPAMYIGSTGQKGLNHLVYEIVDNAVDEACNGYGINVWVAINSDGSCTVTDEGRGIPVDKHESGESALRVVLTTLHAGGKFDGKSYATSGGLHGVGSSVVNALSKSFKVEVHRNKNVYVDSYHFGIPDNDLENGELKSCGKCKDTGTSVTFYPDDSIFSTVSFKASDIERRLHETAYLNPNLTLYFNDFRQSKETSKTFHEPEGIKSYVKSIASCDNAVTDAFCFEGDFDSECGKIQVSVAMQWVESLQEKTFSFCNNILTEEGGTHVSALRSSLTSLVNSYARELGALKEKDPNFMGSDVRSGLCAVVSVKHPDPQFEGQTKTKLENADAGKAVSSVCSKMLALHFDRNLDDIKKVIAIAQKCSKLRKSEASARKSLFSKSKKYSFDSNGKLASCSSKDYASNELFVVEGDSAAGSGKMARDRKHQAILPIRGKILNCERASIDKILANEEIKSIINALGCGFGEGYGNDFDIRKIKYGKIVIMTDADVDGSHITSLLMTMFHRIMPQIISNGYLYCAVPPLYKAFPVKGDAVYLYSDSDLSKYLSGNKTTHIQRYKGLGEMNPKQLWETTMNPETRILKQVQFGDAVYDNLTTSKLMGGNAEERRKFIYERALDANIDS